MAPYASASQDRTCLTVWSPSKAVCCRSANVGKGAAMDLRDRQAELERLVESRRLEWRGRLRDLPDDPRVRVAALATLLGLDAHAAAFKLDVSSDTLVRTGRRDERAIQQYQRDVSEYEERGTLGEREE
jgi:hypothetical protein